MTFLLGTRECLDSLNLDVMDLQKVANDVYRRLNIKPKILSWRSPDMFAYDLGVTDLLKKHSFCKDLEENQLSHVVLFELVIDRLVFILQLLQHFLTCKNDNVVQSPVYSGRSIGIIASKYWKSLDAFLNTFESGNKTKNISSEITLTSVNDPFEEFDFKKTFIEKSCQTMETVFAGCSYCQETELQLILILKQLFLLHSIWLKCENFHLKKKIKIGDSKQAAEDGLKCLDQIEESFLRNEEQCRHLKLTLEEKNLKLESLQNNLIKLEKKYESLKESEGIKIKNLKATIQEMTLKYETSYKENLAKSEIELKMVRERLEYAMNANIKFEAMQKELQNELKNEKEMRKEEVKMITLTLEDVSKKLMEAHAQLKMGQIRNHNHHQHYQFLKSKQVSLTQRLENMDESNLKLQERVVDAERLKEEMEIEIKELKLRLKEIWNDKGIDQLLNNKVLKFTEKEEDNCMLEKASDQDHIVNQKMYSPLTKKNELGGSSLIKMSHVKDDFVMGRWICEFCGEHCDSNSDLNLHITYCVFKI